MQQCLPMNREAFLFLARCLKNFAHLSAIVVHPTGIFDKNFRNSEYDAPYSAQRSIITYKIARCELFRSYFTLFRGKCSQFGSHCALFQTRCALFRGRCALQCRFVLLQSTFAFKQCRLMFKQCQFATQHSNHVALHSGQCAQQCRFALLQSLLVFIQCCLTFEHCRSAFEHCRFAFQHKCIVRYFDALGGYMKTNPPQTFWFCILLTSATVHPT